MELDRLKAYIRGELSYDEAQEIQKASAEDEVLRNTIEGLQLIDEENKNLDEFIDASHDRIREQLVFTSVEIKPQTKSFNLQLYLKLAAAILLIGVVGYLVISSVVEPDYNELADKVLADTDPLDVGDRGIYPWFVSFEQRDYETVINALESRESKSDTELLFLAIALANQQQYVNARNYLNQIPADSPLYGLSYYYTAVILFKEGNEELAKTRFEEILNKKLDGYEKLQEIMD